MDLLWLLVVGLLFAGWFALDGFNIGVGLALPFVTEPGMERRAAITAVGPFLLFNEVWLVATAGVLAGTFPLMEGELLSGLYPVLVVLLVSWAVRDAGFWFRSRQESVKWRAFWDRAIFAGSLGLALTAGLVIGNLVGGLPGEPEGIGVLDPLALACAAVVVGLFALHGAVFLGLRMPRENGERIAALAARLPLPILGAAALTVVLAFVLGDLARPWYALTLAVAGLAAVALAGRLLAAGRHGQAFVCTGVAAVVPVFAVGAGLAPRLLDGAATQETLEKFATMALPVLPVLLLVQVWMWWYFRHRVGKDTVAFF
ncbi:cytochrome d ubiquinol oxidase subunit II [Spirillospora sp. CA-294931]|uniref:cytochrome d ubiquinol oxidase subunit II n=1 Tax=Spirillospora sp. CA-294931 TaxID=3240042 RepID=UPI003D8D3EC9